jgi:hypothetical protein
LVNSVRISARDGIPYVFSRYILALPQCVFHLAIVNRRWRQQAYAGVTVLVVVPPKKSLTESTTVLDAPKAVRELRPIFHGSELALGKGIVVRHVRPTMRFRDTPYRRVREPPAWLIEPRFRQILHKFRTESMNRSTSQSEQAPSRHIFALGRI